MKTELNKYAVAGLVYIAAFAPDKGESVTGSASTFSTAFNCKRCRATNANLPIQVGTEATSRRIVLPVRTP